MIYEQWCICIGIRIAIFVSADGLFCGRYREKEHLFLLVLLLWHKPNVLTIFFLQRNKCSWQGVTRNLQRPAPPLFMMPTWSQDGGGNAIHTVLILPKKSIIVHFVILLFSLGFDSGFDCRFDSGFVSRFDSRFESIFGLKMVVAMQSTPC